MMRDYYEDGFLPEGLGPRTLAQRVTGKLKRLARLQPA